MLFGQHGHEVLNVTTPNDLGESLFGKPIEGCIVSAVREAQTELDLLRSRFPNIIELSGTTPLPIKNRYKTPTTLGPDRICAAIGAWSLFKGHNILVIDAGTCLKCEYISAVGEYLGGAIAPGLAMRAKAMNHFTAKLPLINVNSGAQAIGTSTDEALNSGSFFGLWLEIEGRINHFLEQFPNGKIVLTGGDAKYFEGRTKTPIFADPILVPRGLYEIYLHHA